jgi:hypothetical protein
MKIRLLPCVLAVLIALLAGCCTKRPQAAHSTGAAARVAFENDKMWVVEYSTGSEKDGVCGVGMHTHPAHLYIMLADSKLRIVTPDGKETFENSKAGDIGWEPAEQHICENLMGNNVRCHVIEIKDKDWRPSTGLSK